jgi:isoleucyl-tRNA synthetase
MLDFPQNEEKILQFWEKNRIFEKSLKKKSPKGNFVFYEGPPTANGRPGIHHVLSRSIKDIICRYKTMRGYRVLRKAGWDTHGIPVELEVEKALGFKTKPDIEKYGIGKFIKKCKESVWKYKDEWEKITKRMGFWLVLDCPYITYENDYIESLWWIIKQIWDKGLFYQDYKVVPYCPRCGTTLSSHEVALGYQRVKEPAIYLKFKIKEPFGKTQGPNDKMYLLVWTTTPWTLSANVAIAIKPDLTYVKVKFDDNYLILAKDRLEVLGIGYEVVEEFKGKDLLGLEYEPLYNFVKAEKKVHFVIAGDFVSAEEGTGLVHIAPAFGEDDMNVSKKNDLPILMTLDDEGKFTVGTWQGRFAKDVDPEIIEDLKKRKILWKTETYEHDYPFCWRCNSPLLYYATTSWFIKIKKIQDDLLKNNQEINWIPAHLKEGRFGEWLKDIKDWAFSRQRYWGTPLPIWQCEKCKEKMIIGSLKELEKLSIDGKLPLDEDGKLDLHRPYIDEIRIRCGKCKGVASRVPEVADVWFDSGAMPFAQYHWPFENKKLQAEQYPADFIAEGMDQTRGWFYTLLAISTLLGKGPSYKNVISHGLVLDEKGKKMSKSLGNIVDPWEVINKYGIDALRWYFYTVNQAGEPKLFALKDIEERFRKFISTLYNTLAFFLIYGDKKIAEIKPRKVGNVLDKWSLSKLNNLIKETTEKLDKYDIITATRAIELFVEDLSNWYVRRSRKRFSKFEDKKDYQTACQVLHGVILDLSKIVAPFIPFLADYLYKELKPSFVKASADKSVHLEDWPKANEKSISKELEEQMKKAREICSLALEKRAKAKIKVRQPLQRLTVNNKQLTEELLDLIKDEVNVKEIVFGKTIELDTKITPELKEEGLVREFIRQIQEIRKKTGLVPKDKIIVYFSDKGLEKIVEKNKEFIKKQVIAKDLILREKGRGIEIKKL